jgi:hypothetical protein
MNEFPTTVEYVGIDGDRTVNFTKTTDLSYEGYLAKVEETLSYRDWISFDMGSSTLIVPTESVKSVDVARPEPPA